MLLFLSKMFIISFGKLFFDHRNSHIIRQWPTYMLTSHTQENPCCSYLSSALVICEISGWSTGALVKRQLTKACVPHTEWRITLQQPRSSIWKPSFLYLSSVSNSVALVWGPLNCNQKYKKN